MAAGDLERRRGEYGFDAPAVPIAFGVVVIIFFALAAMSARSGPWAIAPLLSGLSFLLMGAGYVYTTRVGKFVVWAEILKDLRLRGDERVLDLGCGRGAVLLLAAKLLPRGRAVGIDLWSAKDQSGNRSEVTERNARLEGVADRVEVHTGDMRELPFADASFDVVVSSMAIHNIADAGGRNRAIDEAARVLKPGGRVLIADFRCTADYASRLRDLALADVRERRLGWRFWYGGPWTAAKLVTASRPNADTKT